MNAPAPMRTPFKSAAFGRSNVVLDDNRLLEPPAGRPLPSGEHGEGIRDPLGGASG